MSSPYDAGRRLDRAKIAGEWIGEVPQLRARIERLEEEVAELRALLTESTREGRCTCPGETSIDGMLGRHHSPKCPMFRPEPTDTREEV